MVSPTILVVVVILIIAYWIKRQRRQASLPPGPPRLPIIGNLHQLPSKDQWTVYKQWVDTYGPLVSAKFGGTDVVIIGDYDTAKELLDKRGGIYSDRPRMVMAGELVCKNHQILLKPWGEDYLLHQRLEAPILRPRASACYNTVIDLESKQLLFNMLTTSDFVGQYQRFTASVMYVLTFGMRIATGKEWQFQRSLQCLQNFIKALEVGAWIVDALPILNYLPEVLAPWKRTAKIWSQDWEDLHKRNMQDALVRPGWNWSKDLCGAKEAQQMDPLDISWDLGVVCDAGIETTHCTLEIFTLACISYPDWISTAQRELDEVVGPNRLPDFEDLDKLPYIQAIIEENFRWRHILPAGVPHKTIRDDTYKGFLIPKGAMIIPLFIAMRNDKALFDKPAEFIPERWLGKQQQAGNFGYGRRMCTGRHIARTSLSISIARLLWAYNIKSKNGQRNVVSDTESFTSGFVNTSKHFEAVFEVRSEKHKDVVELAFESAEKDPHVLMQDVRKNMVSAGLSPRD
ncbi:putative O-methylsterigmatocystin oxidoreductase [Didymella exigua CBS 183.55]|uniref:Putative O-methylsterigmatocystin oxidoreductase n=1 Tax=Didymella exigua CBS 183.55 TaxID=1150837 RepID=A0A6A5S2D1_9PLEO|nr:putative O-methylsterigmatocystin oxidoreductase [Didymella exigua CBS 183.55]KAF1933770.1 putative O-methylsterigmatocystin oxidoreductase [Didymella exigua CBS 183.55]